MDLSQAFGLGFLYPGCVAVVDKNPGRTRPCLLKGNLA